MKLFKFLSILSFSFFPLSTIEANEFNSENNSFDRSQTEDFNYEPKDKLDEYIIKGATYATKFVPLMNDGSDISAYKSIMANDAKSLLVDSGFDFVNSTANSQIRKIPFFAQTSVNISGGTESDTSFSLNSLMKLG